MKRCHRLIARSLPVLLAVLGCGNPGGPDVVLITIDTLRPDRLGCYGYGPARTPTIDGWASSGTRFENAVTCIPRTTQAVASLFTGRYPAEHGVREIGEYLTLQETTWAEMFSAAGYATFGISANQVAGSFQGLHQGFDDFLDASDLRERYPALAKDGDADFGFAEAVTSEALAWLDRREDAPYFLWLHYIDPHFPYRPPEEYRAGADTTGLAFYRAADSFSARSATISFDLNGHSSAARTSMGSLYDAEIAYVDAMLARLAERFETRDDPPLVILTADHGESLGEHGYFYEHGDFVFDASMRIPMVVNWPGEVAGGQVVTETASLVDLLPSVCGLLDIDMGSQMSGVNLAPVLRGAPASSKIVLGESGSALRFQNPYRSLGGRRRPGPLGQEAFRYARDGKWLAVRPFEGKTVTLYDTEEGVNPQVDHAEYEPEIARRLERALDDSAFLDDRVRMAREGRWKVIGTPRLGKMEWRLFDLDTDPMESTDVSDGHREIVARLVAALEAWWSIEPATSASTEERGGGDAQRIDEELKSLGYID